MSDSELLGAILDVYRHLDLNHQLRALLERAMAWTPAEVGFAFGPGEDAKVTIPIAGSVPEADPRFRALQGLGAHRLAAGPAPTAQRHDGLGPFGSLAEMWPDEQVVSSYVLRIEPDAGGDAAGFLWLVFSEEPGQAEIDALVQLIEMTRPAVSNAIQVGSMRDLVIKDDTARCFNRRYFEEFLPEELARASRFRAPLSLIFFDMDGLKQVNNDHGHAAGSRSLYEVSVRVRSKVRKFDKLFRFGGDEFCIVLPETEWHGALEVAERVREAIASQPFLVNDTGGTGIVLTASMGIASYPLHARSKEGLVQLADRAMQRIKRAQKNSVGVAEIAGDTDVG